MGDHLHEGDEHITRCAFNRATPNENCTRLAKIVGQLEGSINRDFQSKCWAKSRNLGQLCTIFVPVQYCSVLHAPKSGVLTGGSRRRLNWEVFTQRVLAPQGNSGSQ